MKTEFVLLRLPGGEFSMQAVRERETFHPVIGAEREAELLYLEPFAVAQRCALNTSRPLTVWDVGLGAAGNALHLIRCWSRQPARDLHLVSFDLHDRALRFALQHHAADRQKFPWLAGWHWENILRQQGVALTLGGRRLRWEWRLEDFPSLLASAAAAELAAPELVFYDAYSPRKSWYMWTLGHWQNLRRCCSADCEIAFHSRSTALRVTLLLAGFYVGYGAAIGGKEQTTVAATRLALLREPLGVKWLESVRRSTAARPFRNAEYQPAPITGEDYAQVAAQPQFAQG